MLTNVQPTRLISIVIGSILLLLTALYLTYVVMPSYTSGLYRLSEYEIWQGHLDVPGYTFNPVNAEGNWRVNIAIFSGAALRCLFLPLSGCLIVALVKGRRALRAIEIGVWGVVVVAILGVLIITDQAAAAFLTWIFD
jgi:hypothetical protein